MNKEGHVNTATSNWIYVEDKENPTTIADFPYNTGVDMSITKPRCWRCIVVNKCWFKNDKDKKATQYGVKINVFFSLPGINEKKGKFYKTWSNFMVFPNGTLKNNTLIGGKDK